MLDSPPQWVGSAACAPHPRATPPFPHPNAAPAPTRRPTLGTGVKGRNMCARPSPPSEGSRGKCGVRRVTAWGGGVTCALFSDPTPAFVILVFGGQYMCHDYKEPRVTLTEVQSVRRLRQRLVCVPY
ncbi:hypothetical protein E2C01_087959 [Portunus trituberculatus]|uniref:Uncharacterized protein n=1 Tax=Portunus trituberculatus TaxID=210409 RepID=A0A5B7JIM3_PORTR|nr:hypothetical protein [Portunus trituberculatus]